MKIIKVPLSEISTWKNNPRYIRTVGLERLKKQIKELGIYKPLICVEENGGYVTLGGNMRLKALEILGYKEAEISIVEAEDEATKIKYALSDNDQPGEYDVQQLAELVFPHIEDINLEDYKVDLGKSIDLKQVLGMFGPDDKDSIPEEEGEGEDLTCPKCGFKWQK